MRRSRDLAFKRDRESKLQNVMSVSKSSQQNASLFSQQSQRPPSRSATVVLPQNTLVSRNTKPSTNKKEEVFVSKQSNNRYSDDNEDDEELRDEMEQDDDTDKNYDEPEYDDMYEEEEEEEVKKPVTKNVVGKSKNVDRNVKPQKVVEKVVEKVEKVEKTTTKRGRKKQEEKHVEEEVDDDRHDDVEDRQDDEEGGRKRRQNLVSKTILSKLLQEAGIEGVSSDVYGFIIEEMQYFIQDIIQMLGESSNGEELVVRDSDLKFLGDKSRAPGYLDIKSFEKVYRVVAGETNTNAEFSSEAFKTLGKFTEIHVVQFLRKAGNVIKFYGRKRLTVKDLELLKEMLEDEK